MNEELKKWIEMKTHEINSLNKYPQLNKYKIKFLNELEQKKQILNRLNKDEEEIKKKKEEELRKQEEEELNKQEVLKREKIIKESSENIIKNEINYEIIKEKISIFGDELLDEIKKEEKENPQNFIDYSKIEENDENFPLFLLANSLKNKGIYTSIEKYPKNKNITDACLQIISSGLLDEKKVLLTLDYGQEQNEKILKNEFEKNKFVNNLKDNLSSYLHINKNDIKIINIKRGSILTDILIEYPKNDIKNKLDNFVKDNKYVKEYKISPLLNACKLSLDIFNPSYNVYHDYQWARKGEKRGSKEYFPPYGWEGYALNVTGKYDKGNNTWLGMSNKEDEWCVAYHGIGRDNIKDKIDGIISSGIKNGKRNAYSDSNDLNNNGKKVGNGAYLTPKIEVAEQFTTECEGFKIAFMCRVNPNRIRIPEDKPDYWVLNGNVNEIRPYRLLIKSSNNSHHLIRNYSVRNFNLLNKKNNNRISFNRIRRNYLFFKKDMNNLYNTFNNNNRNNFFSDNTLKNNNFKY